MNSQNGMSGEVQMTILPFHYTYFKLEKATDIDNKAKAWNIQKDVKASANFNFMPFGDCKIESNKQHLLIKK